MNRSLAMVGAVVCLLATIAQAPAASPEPLWSADVVDKKFGSATVCWLGFSPDGRHLVTLNEMPDKEPFTRHLDLRTWRVKSWEEAPRRQIGNTRPEFRSAVPLVAFMAQSQVLIGGRGLEPRSVKLNDNAPAVLLPQGQLLERESGNWGSVGIWATADSKAYFLLKFYNDFKFDRQFGDRPQLSRWSAPPAVPPRALNCQPKIKKDGVLSVADISPDGTKMAMVTKKPVDTDNLELQEIVTGQELELKPLSQVEQPHLGEISVLRFSPDSRSLVSGSADGVMKLWDVAAAGGKWKERATIAGPNYTVSSVAFQPNGRIVAFGTYDPKKPSIWLVDVATGKLLQSFHEARGVTAIGFSPDGKMLATASLESIKVWDVEKLLRGE